MQSHQRIRTSPFRRFFLGTTLALLAAMDGGCSGVRSVPVVLGPVPGAGGGGDTEFWNGDSGQLTLLRAQTYLRAYVSLARRIRTGGPGSESFFSLDCANSVHCLALQSLSPAEYEELVTFARNSLDQIVAFGTETPVLKFELATAPMYPDASAPSSLQGVRMYAMANFNTRTIRLDPTAVQLDDDYFADLLGHEFGHLLRLKDAAGNLTNNHYGWQREGFLTAFGAGLKIAIGDEPPPFYFDSTFNYMPAGSDVLCMSGRVCPNFAGSTEPTGVVLQPDGKILVAGTHQLPAAPPMQPRPLERLYVLRYSPDGTLDATFGTNGKVEVSNAGLPTFGGPISVFPDGRILVLGKVVVSANTERLSFVMLNTNGSLVSTYGANGIYTEPDFTVTTAAGLPWRTYRLNSIATSQSLPDGSVIAGGRSCVRGTTTYCYPLLLKLKVDGNFDPAFGDTRLRDAGGVAETAPISASAVWRIHSLALDGTKIVAGGVAGNNAQAILLRYTAEGRLDPTFGTGHGWAVPSYLTRLWEVVVTKNGVSPSGSYPTTGGRVFRLNANATAMDLEFAQDGRLDFDIGDDVFATLPFGSSRVAALRKTGSDIVSFAKFNTDGGIQHFRPTPEAGADPIVHRQFPFKVTPLFMIMQAYDGMVLVVGKSSLPASQKQLTIISRHWPAGSY